MTDVTKAKAKTLVRELRKRGYWVICEKDPLYFDDKLRHHQGRLTRVQRDKAARAELARLERIALLRAKIEGQA